MLVVIASVTTSVPSSLVVMVVVMFWVTFAPNRRPRRRRLRRIAIQIQGTIIIQEKRKAPPVDKPMINPKLSPIKQLPLFTHFSLQHSSKM